MAHRIEQSDDAIIGDAMETMRSHLTNADQIESIDVASAICRTLSREIARLQPKVGETRTCMIVESAVAQVLNGIESMAGRA